AADRPIPRRRPASGTLITSKSFRICGAPTSFRNWVGYISPCLTGLAWPYTFVYGNKEGPICGQKETKAAGWRWSQTTRSSRCCYRAGPFYPRRLADNPASCKKTQTSLLERNSSRRPLLVQAL